MKNFTPGLIVHQFITRNGQQVIIRYPQPTDIDAMTEYINTISQEDTYVSVSGEQITKEEELKYLEEQFDKIEFGDSVLLVCTINGNMIGISGVSRNQSSRRRALHMGIFGLSIKKEFRNLGIGYELAKCVINEVKIKMHNIRIITLTVYKPNEHAKKLYEKLGFNEYGYLPGGVWYRDGYLDEISMYLPLINS